MEKKKDQNPKYLKYRQVTINLNEFKALDNESQINKIKESLDKMWDGKIKIDDAYVNKCIKLSLAKYDDELHLPKKLLVENNGKELLFSYKPHRNNAFFFLLFGLLLLVGGFSATYSGIILLKRAELNQDIDGDGIPDINIDLDNDGIADINIDPNKDKIPELNIDYKGNNKPTFNLDKDNDGVPDFNLVNDATKDNTCKLNCDATGNGWPDYNIDIDGDGVPDLDIDTDGDKIPDINIDSNGDGKPDINIDTDNDGKCDINCIPGAGSKDDIKHSGTSTETGDKDSGVSSVSLMVIYSDEGYVNITGVFPDDQENVTMPPMTKKFTVTNNTDYKVAYKLSWIVDENTFTSNNFQYKLESTNGGFNQDFTTAPWNDTTINEYVLIDPNTTQSYTLTFRLVGIGAPQNYDQNKTFAGYIKVGE